MDNQLQNVYIRALRAITDAGGIEGDALKSIVCSFDPTAPADRLGLAMIAAALHERQRRGYAAEWEAAQRNALTAIAFPEGAQTPVTMQSRGGPFPLLHLERARTDRDATVTAYVEDVAAQVSEVARQPIAYILTELTANVWDHAETDTAFVLAGADEQSLVLAVVDAGISIPFSYARRDITFESDGAALLAALEGKSARPQGGRGYGLRTTVKLAVDGWGGRCLIASRHAAVFQSRNGREPHDISPLYWNGTVAALELPLPLQLVDLYTYVEG